MKTITVVVITRYNARAAKLFWHSKQRDRLWCLVQMIAQEFAETIAEHSIFFSGDRRQAEQGLTSCDATLMAE